MRPLVGEGMALVTEGTEEAGLLNAAIASVLTSKQPSRIPDPGDQGKGMSGRRLSLG